MNALFRLTIGAYPSHSPLPLCLQPGPLEAMLGESFNHRDLSEVAHERRAGAVGNENSRADRRLDLLLDRIESIMSLSDHRATSGVFWGGSHAETGGTGPHGAVDVRVKYPALTEIYSALKREARYRFSHTFSAASSTRARLR